MYSAKEIARYIIDYSEDQGHCVSNLRLQKLLYFIQADFLVQKNRKCFDEDIVAWDSGPVVPEVWEEYSRFGAASIYSTKTDIDWYDILEDDQTTIRDLLKYFEQYSTTQLLQITLNQLPYKKGRAWSRERVIKPEWIKEYFEES